LTGRRLPGCLDTILVSNVLALRRFQRLPRAARRKPWQAVKTARGSSRASVADIGPCLHLRTALRASAATHPSSRRPLTVP